MGSLLIFCGIMGRCRFSMTFRKLSNWKLNVEYRTGNVQFRSGARGGYRVLLGKEGEHVSTRDHARILTW